MYVLKLFNGKLPLDEKCKRLLKTLFLLKIIAVIVIICFT